MLLKNKLFIGLFVFVTGIMSLNAKTPFSSGVPALDAIEMSVMIDNQAANQAVFVEQMNSAQMQHFLGRIIGKTMMLSMVLNQRYNASLTNFEQAGMSQGCAEVLKGSDILSSLLKEDKELTSLVVNPICFLCGKVQEFIHQNSHVINNIEFEDIDSVYELFSDYLPHVKVDVFDCFVSYCISGRLYLKQKLEETGTIAATDLFDVARDLVVQLQFPEKAQGLWGGLLASFEKGYKEMPADTQEMLNSINIEWLRDSKHDDYLASMESLLQMRHVLMNKSLINELSEEDLILYKSKFVDLVQQGNQLSAHLLKKHPLFLEKMVFKN